MRSLSLAAVAPLAAVALAVAPAAADPSTPAEPPTAVEPAVAANAAAGTYACWQSFASYGPTGALSAYHRAPRGTLVLRENGTYRARGERWLLPRGAGRTGAWSGAGDRVRFADGPYRSPRHGFRLIGDLHPAGVEMPHDLEPGTRYALVLRSRRGARPADAAPPRAEREDFFVSFWYCQAT